MSFFKKIVGSPKPKRPENTTSRVTDVDTGGTTASPQKAAASKDTTKANENQEGQHRRGFFDSFLDSAVHCRFDFTQHHQLLWSSLKSASALVFSIDLFKTCARYPSTAILQLLSVI